MLCNLYLCVLFITSLFTLVYFIIVKHTSHDHTPPPPPPQNGGDINIADADKHTPLFYARNYGHQDIVNILLANSCTEDTSDTSV